MWALYPIPTTPFLSKPNRPTFRPLLRNLWRSHPPQNDNVYGEETGGLGHTILTNLSNSDPKQLTGSDVLWALQKASSAKKKKKNRKRRELSSADSHREEDEDDDDGDDVVDYSNVKPLSINSDWAVKLHELEKRLQELSDIN
ncbi:hypothetical protein Dsin_025846 [Dipteronia sinensis]|uniref:Uncharacterized protein n=1 Tax=Dipteronia sinensis TaxID=43782 RepID=A0AAE0DXI2_9ROSI|nr:hypothetical protein Dsin_025846 [Dipteronia sinensis]